MAGYLIHTPSGLSPSAELRASELGPAEVTAAASPDELARSVGFSVIVQDDVTAAFSDTCGAILRAREQFEAALRAAESDAAYDEEQTKKRNMLEGISEGLLQRSLIVADKR